MKAVESTRTSARLARTAQSPDATVGLAEIEDAFDRADYARCRSLITLASAFARTRTARASLALFEARCARVQGDDAVWLASAEAASLHPDPAIRLEATALHAHALRRFGKSVEADREFELLQRTYEREPSSLVGEALYYLALDACFAGRYDTCDALISENVVRGAAVSRSLSLLGWTEVKRERFARAGAYFIDGLERLRASGQVDLRLEGSLIYAATVVASETADLKLAKRVTKFFDDFTWPHASALERFNTLLGLRNIALLEGDLERAWLLSREAVVRAPSVATEALGEASSAAVTRLLGDERIATLQFERAWELLRKRRTGAADEETRLALATFAFEAAADMPSEARKAMTMHDSLVGKESTSNSLARDSRMRALALMASARVAEARGDRERAKALYRGSFDLWQILRYDMRAAVIARDLRRITRDRKYDAIVDAVLARAPKAWFGTQSSASNEVLEQVTPAELLVLRALIEGKSAREIAEGLDRSVHTINNHTRKIFKAFGVTSRAGVLARCATYGITPKSLGRTS